MAEGEPLGVSGNVVGEFRFDDVTLQRADGLYTEVRRLMEAEPPAPSTWVSVNTPKEPVKWFLITSLHLIHNLGESLMGIELHYDGSVVITSFIPSDPDPLMNYDIRLLRQWTEVNGWKVPRPGAHVISDRLPFWKHLWQFGTVDSPDLERRFGSRKEQDDELREADDDDDDDVS